MKNILVSTLAVLIITSAASAQSEPLVREYKLEEDKQISFQTLIQDKLAVYKIISGKQTVSLRVLPGGYIEILEGSTTLRLSLNTPNGKVITLNIGLSEGVALWPVSNFSLRGSNNFFVSTATIADDFFTIKAIKARRGLKVQTPQGVIPLRASQRLEGNASAKTITYRLVSNSFPGRKLELASKLPVKDKSPSATPVADSNEKESWLPFSDLLFGFEDINDAARQSK